MEALNKLDELADNDETATQNAKDYELLSNFFGLVCSPKSIKLSDDKACINIHFNDGRETIGATDGICKTCGVVKTK